MPWLPIAGILACYDYPISRISLKGTDNKIKTMKRQAYGARHVQPYFLNLSNLEK